MTKYAEIRYGDHVDTKQRIQRRQRFERNQRSRGRMSGTRLSRLDSQNAAAQSARSHVKMRHHDAVEACLRRCQRFVQPLESQFESAVLVSERQLSARDDYLRARDQ